jgi:hypothetical protein
MKVNQMCKITIHSEVIFVYTCSPICLPFLKVKSYSQRLSMLTAIAAIKVTIKLTSNRPWRPIGLWDIEDPTLLDNWLKVGDEDVSLTHRLRSIPQKHYFVLLLVLSSVRDSKPQGLVRWKEDWILVMLATIQSRTFGLLVCYRKP